ncbi:MULTISPECIES: Fic family protein [Asaia]|uniref:Uncharacterized protein n=1 Tax=Asaia spathodeae TaxID=657016 RepID=A0ABX2P8A2_9PROT|nr:hypothetical protein [Asaia spathodeae]GBR20451.1 hypothetical protein AA105894_2560 [Asaia spathodeae NBRC 105894]
MSGRQNPSPFPSDRLYAALSRTAVAIGRLDQRLHNHPLLPAILFRERIEAARLCAAADGCLIDPWHLAAELEGLRPRFEAEDALERGARIDNARIALEQYQWLCRPTQNQTVQISAAVMQIRDKSITVGPLLGAAKAFHAWIDAGNARAPMRGALVLFWQEARLIRVGLPLTGARAFTTGTSWERALWIPRFLDCLAEEAEAMETRVDDIERQWRHARGRSGAQRSTSRANTAIDLIAAFPLVSATRLAQMLHISIKASYVMLERFLADEIVVEVTHRSARRLFALKGFEPLRDIVSAPRRPIPGRRRGRPRREVEETICNLDEKNRPLAPFSPQASLDVDYDALEEAIAATDKAIEKIRKINIDIQMKYINY